MLKISFIFAVLLVAKGLVSAQPVNVRPPSTVVTRDVSSPPPSITERLFNVVVDSLSGKPQPSGSSNPVAPPSPSATDGQKQDIDDRAFSENRFESRGLFDREELKNELKRRMMNDKYMELLTRALYERMEHDEPPRHTQHHNGVHDAGHGTRLGGTHVEAGAHVDGTHMEAHAEAGPHLEAAGQGTQPGGAKHMLKKLVPIAGKVANHEITSQFTGAALQKWTGSGGGSGGGSGSVSASEPGSE
ncbi:hypothetical protein APHAL10511_002930 [Amanita phalloides]|nr:hypothetical protein APHAL10511_002930 [Amanita phalloides]